MFKRVSYRLRQFWAGATAVYTKADDQFARGYLTIEEFSLFRQLPDFERKHCVNVARKMLEAVKNEPRFDERKIVRLGLLHDIGKIRERNTLYTKGVLVVIRFLAPWLYDALAERGKRSIFFRRFYIHKHHGAVGAELLARMGESPEIVMMVKKHDPKIEPWGPDDPIELKLLQEADSSF